MISKAILFVLISVSVASAQRLCSSPYCAMCNRLEAHYNQRLRLQIPVSSPAPVLVSQPIDYTPAEAMDAMLSELELHGGDVLYDVGCADGRVLIAAAQKYGCRGVGIEIDVQTAEIARRNVARSGLSGQIRIVTGDALNYRYDGATAATVYLYPDLVAKLAPKLARVGRVASYSHEIPGRECRQVMVAGRYPIFISDSRIETAQETWSWLASSGERGVF